MLNRIWTFFFLGGFLAAVVRAIGGHTGVWGEIVGATFDMAKTGFEIALGLTGVMCLWLGIMKIGEAGGAVGILSRLKPRSPFIRFVLIALSPMATGKRSPSRVTKGMCFEPN